jgi:hypothetical protein
MGFTAQRTANASSLNFGRIAKPLRGGSGSGSGVGSGPGMTSPGGYSSANPLARLQGEDGGGSGTYEICSRVYCAPQAGVLIANANRMAWQLLRNVHHGSSRRHECREARLRFDIGVNGWEGGWPSAQGRLRKAKGS